ncbi:thioredoxin domain-containing protein 9 [Tribolium castaneum]|uniref:Thioredoxin domain-containing protein 9 n=1 Tax=Tribolium castaneum TaxID=7070 RepID=D6WZ07_TRICA|nr:PREDICTED: thioredoxin domain-containing protein 9 [Tribolium castaneum]EFA07835.1 Thioredoxin domain-containing protein 9-like Protein [Tribolium castaneum]|eukprot:XP_970614.1 PREDICTED: thioredoxin domain-containing protein 9 [Tribolium castaneum]
MNQLEDKILHVTKAIERQVDSAIEQIENLDVNDLESLRKQRLNELKKKEAQRNEWLSLGHGKYEELAEEKEFFDVTKRSKNCVVHFYTNTTPRCAIVDKHLKILAPKHLETRFVKLNAEKCPFLAQNLKIKTIPSIVLVKDSFMVDKIVGFTQLGNRDDFTTEMMEWRIAQNGVIDYEGDLLTPPHLQEKRSKSSGKKIRDGAYDRDDDDLDIEEYALNRDSLKSGDSLSKVQATELTPEEAAELGLDD